MGKVLDSLKRRDAPHALTAEPKLPRASSLEEDPHPPLAEATAALPRRDYPPPVGFDDSEMNIPFIEVPNSSGSPLTSSGRPLGGSLSSGGSGVADAGHGRTGPTVSASPAPAVRFEHDPAPAGRGLFPSLAFGNEGPSALRQEYRRARDEMLPVLQARKLKEVLLVPGDESPALAAAVVNLALSFAEGGDRSVLLVDANRESRLLAGLLGLAPAPGWQELLADYLLTQVIQETDWYRLHGIAAGIRLAQTSPSWHGEKVARLMEALRPRYDLVLFQGGTLLGAEPPVVLARVCQASCLVTNGQADPSAALVLRRHSSRFLGTLTITSTT